MAAPRGDAPIKKGRARPSDRELARAENTEARFRIWALYGWTREEVEAESDRLQLAEGPREAAGGRQRGGRRVANG